MTDQVAMLPTPKTPTDYKAAITRLLNEMVQAEEQMQQDRTEMGRFRAKSEVITLRTDVALERLSKQIEALASME